MTTSTVGDARVPIPDDEVPYCPVDQRGGTPDGIVSPNPHQAYRVWTTATCDCTPPKGHYWTGTALMVDGVPCPTWRPLVRVTGPLVASPLASAPTAAEPVHVVTSQALDGPTPQWPRDAVKLWPHAHRAVRSVVDDGTGLTVWLGLAGGHRPGRVWAVFWKDARLFNRATWNGREVKNLGTLRDVVLAGVGVPELKPPPAPAKAKARPARNKKMDHLA